MQKVKVFLQNQSGATAIEYGLIAALIAVAAIAGMRAVGSGVNSTFNQVAGELGGSGGGGGGGGNGGGGGGGNGGGGN